MARPPRISVLLPWEKSVVYFVTFCVEGREWVLANERVFGVFCEGVEELGRRELWHVWGGVVMPDHVHVVASPLGDRDRRVGDLAGALKRWMRKGESGWKWQPGCFDRLCRGEESVSEKWEYVRMNPVRAGLVGEVEKWPYLVGWRDVGGHDRGEE